MRAGLGSVVSSRHWLPCKLGYVAALCAPTQPCRPYAGSGAWHLSGVHAVSPTLLGGISDPGAEKSILLMPWCANLGAGGSLSADTRGCGRQKAVMRTAPNSLAEQQAQVLPVFAFVLTGMGPCTDTLQTARLVLQRQLVAGQPCQLAGREVPV